MERTKILEMIVEVITQLPREFQVRSRSSLGSSEAGDRLGSERDQQQSLGSVTRQTVSQSVDQVIAVLLNGYDNSFKDFWFWSMVLTFHFKLFNV